MSLPRHTGATLPQRQTPPRADTGASSVPQTATSSARTDGARLALGLLAKAVGRRPAQPGRARPRHDGRTLQEEHITVRVESKVSEVMTKDPLTVGPDTSLRVAKGLMRDKGIRHLPVVEETGRLLGVLTDRDVRHAAFVPALAEYLTWESRRLKAPRVRDVMTWSVVTTHPDATLAQAGLSMFQRRIGSLPVVDNGRLVGILTDTDLLRAMGSADTSPDA